MAFCKMCARRTLIVAALCGGMVVTMGVAGETAAGVVTIGSMAISR